MPGTLAAASAACCLLPPPLRTQPQHPRAPSRRAAQPGHDIRTWCACAQLRSPAVRQPAPRPSHRSCKTGLHTARAERCARLCRVIAALPLRPGRRHKRRRRAPARAACVCCCVVSRPATSLRRRRRTRTRRARRPCVCAPVCVCACTRAHRRVVVGRPPAAAHHTHTAPIHRVRARSGTCMKDHDAWRRLLLLRLLRLLMMLMLTMMMIRQACCTSSSSTEHTWPWSIRE